MKKRVTGALAARIWALTPAKLDEVSAFVESLLQGGKSQWDAAASPAGPSVGDYRVSQDGIAIIRVEGVIERRANMVGSFSGGTSTQMLAQAIVDAAAAGKVSAIVLDIDSPGGSALAPAEVADAIMQARASVPVVAWTGGQMCSAAYWIGSACDAIVAMDTSVVGSIGVAAVHYDRSAADAQEGVTRTVLSAGKYKRIASDEKPLSDEGREYLQSQIDLYYTKFVDAVAQGRGVEAAVVLERMADGRVFIGREALDAGLVDHIGNFEVALEVARERRSTMSEKKDAKSASQLSGVTLENLTQERPDLLAEARAGLVDQADVDNLVTAAVAAERARIVEILEADGDQAVTMSAIKDGTPSADVFKAFFQAEKGRKAEAHANLLAGLGESAGASGQSKDQPAETFEGKVAALMAEGKTRGQATAEAANNFPELHAAYIARQQK